MTVFSLRKEHCMLLSRCPRNKVDNKTFLLELYIYQTILSKQNNSLLFCSKHVKNVDFIIFFLLFFLNFWSKFKKLLFRLLKSSSKKQFKRFLCQLYSGFVDFARRAYIQKWIKIPARILEYSYYLKIFIFSSFSIITSSLKKYKIGSYSKLIIQPMF